LCGRIIRPLVILDQRLRCELLDTANGRATVLSEGTLH
jgi:hypothetical protein